MSLLFRYVLKENLRILGWIFSVLTMLCLLIDFFDRWDDLLEHQVPAAIGLYYMMCRTPQFIVYVIPVSMLLSGFITLGLMGRRNELIALKASGASGFMIVSPLLVTAGSLCIVSFFWAELLVPRATREAMRIWRTEVKRTSQRSIVSQAQVWLRSPGEGFTNFYRIGFLETSSKTGLRGKEKGPGDLTMRDVTVLTVDRDFRLAQRIDAREMSWDGTKWVLLEGTQWMGEGPQGGAPRVERFQTKEIHLPEKPEDFQWVREEVESMGFFELLAYVERAKREGFDATAQLTDLHFKVAASFFPLITALFTIPLAMRIPPRTAGLATGVVLSMAIGFVYYLILALGLAMGRGGMLPPFVGAWASNICFGAAGVWWLIHMKQ